ncbi:DJ-1/PfpI family protein [Nocardia sp. NPDC050799]|uniref:DJ-1/PfpI family protein n=1 Tax=Nocardia sp. NPDC050799 TaxID=3154842 RepID=UPI0033E822BD
MSGSRHADPPTSIGKIGRRAFTAIGLAGGAAMLTAGAPTGQPPGGEPTPAGEDRKTHITMLLYPGTTVLDWIGPYEVLHRVPGVEFVLTAATTDLMTSDSGLVDYKANIPLDRIERTDVLIVPGGAQGVMGAAEDPVIADWLRRIDRTTIYTVGVCTGSLILAHIGLLRGRRATTYWKFPSMLEGAGATFVPQRWVRDGKYWTSAGVSAGIDISLALTADLYGAKRAMTTQLAIEYDPRPPFDAGSVRTAPPDVVDALGGIMPPHSHR